MSQAPLDAAQRAVARSEIRAVLDRYGMLARDLADFNRIAEDCFAPGAIYQLPNGKEVPTTQLSDVIQGEEAKYIRHHVTTADIKFVSATEAKVETNFIAHTDSASPDHWGSWKDTFVAQSDGTWKLQHRAIIIDDGVTHGWYMKQYGSVHQKPAQGNPHSW
ncbi:hypothetical protein B0A52_03718 [Exophiala mesophila]|uniref:SnoaL-like domain-containing protein n=1 Tax=Exophiala mesophila TaxID=212818 RepID=A0A438N9S7_EXOME|nr:hypothetical protein B0A52_03718 [Exophiala mesophila]